MFHLQDHMLRRYQQSLSIQPEPHRHFQNAVAYCCHQYCLATSILSCRVWTFVVGAELAVQSQQRRTTVHDTHSCSQHCLVLEQTSGS